MSTSRSFSTLVALCAFYIGSIESHSWVHCTNYYGGMVNYDDSQCRGYPRSGASIKQAGFGVDRGLDELGKCQATYDEGQADYAAAPKAEYKAGQTVCLAYPAKNHAASSKNLNIEDGGTVISRTQIGDTSDSFNGRTYEHMNGVHQKGVIDFKGFQKCPDYEADNDKSLCTMCFKLEDDIAVGEYSFRWNWEFNKGQFYHTCWEAKVVAGAPGPVPPSAAPYTPPVPQAAAPQAAAPQAAAPQAAAPQAAAPLAPSSPPAPAASTPSYSPMGISSVGLSIQSSPTNPVDQLETLVREFVQRLRSMFQQ